MEREKNRFDSLSMWKHGFKFEWNRETTNAEITHPSGSKIVGNEHHGYDVVNGGRAVAKGMELRVAMLLVPLIAAPGAVQETAEQRRERLKKIRQGP